MAKLVHSDTNEILGEKVPWKKLPYRARMLFLPFKKKNKLMYFQDFIKPSVYGCVLESKGVVLK